MPDPTPETYAAWREEWEREDGWRARKAEVNMLLAVIDQREDRICDLEAPETPPSSPESVPEAQTAPVGPERPCADCEHAYSTHSFPWPGSGEVCTWGQGYEGRLCGCRGFR